jgi:hypothetical protein
VAFFLTALTFFIAYYHRQWRLGAVGTIAALSLPCVANTLWVRLSASSVLYPSVVVVLVGLISLLILHRKLSGPNWDDEIDEEQLRALEAAFESGVTFSWMGRVILLWWIAVAVLLSILFLR